ncbi:uncharacterized protein K452DRAFT_348336 [Aplosporella prunicola CBS 121167]|uniref:Ubiquitin-conjugating enzyme E2C-binding protein n=1 Tax=Aplosporella prunicola CBS 121167 TaxID=1176127 RepID=A0A6A6BTP9_9PEZI|nr:uncharacterized protein K452DRAFT_348336 [Aplosporella prunicola CBS 121167]KAF2146594.1 hypothetical protein K452DRAFT_348336 [Aplosporella prunicola CBS 121167]
MSSILQLYVELLLNIRTVTLFASLKSEHTDTTKAELSADGEAISLTHEGETATIRLPTRISGGGSATLTLPATPSKDLTLRMQLQEKSPGLLKLNERSENATPWSAGFLSDGEDGGISRWMDLPNENWAEMMDFWHCHKPDEHHLPDHKHEAGRDKGYAAANKLFAKVGVGYVDLSYILLTEVDCCGVQLNDRDISHTHQQQLVCKQCTATVGAVDERAEGWRLFKWSMAVTGQSSGVMKSYSMPKWISAQLLTLIENQGIRKFTVRSEPISALPATTLWVFSPDLSFSSSVDTDAREDPTRAMKVLWQPDLNQPHSSERTSGSQALDSQSLSMEELSLPKPAFEALIDTLTKSAQWLPASARKFQDWNVGLLKRFEENEID